MFGPAFQCLIDRVQDRSGGEFIEAAAIAVEMALAAKLLARQARQRILHHPHIARCWIVPA